jgi:hypothetical protein
MLFDYYNPKNIDILIESAQILHLSYIILFIIWLICGFIYLCYRNTVQSQYILFLSGIILLTGIGCIINATAVIVIKNLTKL